MSITNHLENLSRKKWRRIMANRRMFAKYGEDDGEIIIKDAEVIAIL